MKYNGLIIIFVIQISLLSATALALSEATGPGASNAKAVHELGYKGQGINIGLMGSKNIYVNHEAFFDKDANGLPIGSTHAFNYDVSGSGIALFDHDTWMAGIAVSRGGTNNPNDIGVAPEADIHCARVVSDGGSLFLVNGLNKLIVDNSCRVITTAFGIIGDVDGTSETSLIYDYYAFTYDVMFINGAGNGNNVLWIPADAFNGISSGGLIETSTGIYKQVGSTSGSGKTTDLRRKPDVTAPSNNQYAPHTGTNTWIIPPFHSGETSLSSPQVAGVAALLLNYADSSSNTNDHHNEVIRSVIVNSTNLNINDKQGLSTNPTTTVWHKDRGYGGTDAFRAYQLLSFPEVSPSVTITQTKGWAFQTMTNTDQNDVYSISAQKDQRLVLTATWNRLINKTGPRYTEESPRLNIDLKITGPSNQLLFEETSASDNLEKVDILLPEDGNYEIILNKKTDHTNRSYAMAFELIDKIPADFNINYIVDINDLSAITNNWLLPVSNNPIDLYEDGQVDLQDFSVFSSDWLSFNPTYY